jgi:choice-of-anchor C domain-containing protein
MTRVLAIWASLTLTAGLAGSSSAFSSQVRSQRTHFVRPFASLCPAYPGGTGLLVDGDFSQATDPGSSLPTFKNGHTFAPDWVVFHKNINLYGSTAWNPQTGFCSVDVDGQKPGGIEHSAFATTTGATYTVSFLLSGNGACGPTVKQMLIGAAGQSQQFTWDISNSNDAQHNQWAPESWSFQANSSSAVLTFLSQDPKRNACGPVVAAISVTQN